MNKMPLQLARTALAQLLLIPLLLAAGCASTGGVLTLKQTKINVDWKITAYETAAPSGSFTLRQTQQVAAARKAWQEAFQQGLTSAHGNLDAPAPPNVVQAANQLIDVISACMP